MGACCSKGAGGFPKIERKEFKDTKIGEVDEYFKTLQTPLDTLCDISTAITTGNESLQSLCDIDEIKAQLTDAAADVKEIIKVVIADIKKNDIKIELKLADDFSSIDIEWSDTPDGYIGKCIEAVMNLINAIKELFEKVPAILDEVKEAIMKIKEWTPDKLKEMAIGAGLGGKAIAMAAKNIGCNVKSLAGVPGDVAGLVDAIKELCTTIKDTVA